MRWILTVQAYFKINRKKYLNPNQVLVTLKKMSKGWHATFAEGWYVKPNNNKIPADQKTFNNLPEDFTKAFVQRSFRIEPTNPSTPSSWQETSRELQPISYHIQACLSP